MSVPVIINNRDRVSSTRKLVEDLQRLNYEQIYILDNGSSNPDLLQLYDTLPSVSVQRFSNVGPRALWDSGFISKFKGWIVYTDSDIELHPNTPPGFIEDMIRWTEHLNYNKGGLALSIEGIEEHHAGYQYIDWEKRYWNKQIYPGIYEAEIDTTFSVFKANQPFQYKALRFAEYPALHLPWFTEFSTLSPEEKYYLDHASDESTYKRLYKKYLTTNG